MGGGVVKKSQAIKGFVIFCFYSIAWLSIFMICIKMLNNFQQFLFQKPGEILYTTQAFAVSSLVMLFFMPFAAYYIIVKIFFPLNHRREIRNSHKEFAIKNPEILDIVIVTITIVGIIFSIYFFRMYIVVANDYVALSSPGLTDNRTYYKYSDIDVMKRAGNGPKDYLFYFKSAPLFTSFLDNEELIRNIKKHQEGMEKSVFDVKAKPRSMLLKDFLARLVSIIVMTGGSIYIMRLLIGKKGS